MSSHHYHIRDEKGSAIVEFALVLPVLTLILFAMLHFGKAIAYWNDATHLTAEAARFAAVNRKPDMANGQSLQQQIRTQLVTGELKNGSGDVTPAQICVDFPNGTSNGGDPVRVKLTFTYNWMPLVGLDVASTSITASSVMRLEAPPSNYTAGCA